MIGNNMRSASGPAKRASQIALLIPWSKAVQPETGTVVHRSWNKTVLKIAIAGTAAAGGLGITCISGFGATQAWTKKPDYLVLILLALAVLALIGLCLLVIGVFLAFTHGSALYHKERLVIGKKYLQCLVGTTNANMQLPFDNILKIAWATRMEPNGVEYPYIGIDVDDHHRDDTIINPAWSEANRQSFDYDLVILDDYELGLQDLFDRLTARWMKGKRIISNGENGDADADSASRKRPQKSKGASQKQIGNFIVAGVLFLCLIFGGIALLFMGRGMFNRPLAPVAITGDAEIDKALAGLDSKNPFECQAAADRLAKMQPNRHQAVVAKKLANMSQAPDIFSRKKIVQALGVWATPDDLPILIRALDDPDVFTRHEALNAIGRFRDERSLAPVMRCLLDPATRMQAEKALIEIGPLAEGVVMSHLSREDVFERQAAIRVLKEIGTQKSVPDLEPLAAGDNVFLSGPAHEALTAITARNHQ